MRTPMLSLATLGAMLALGLVDVQPTHAQEVPSKHDRRPPAAKSPKARHAAPRVSPKPQMTLPQRREQAHECVEAYVKKMSEDLLAGLTESEKQQLEKDRKAVETNRDPARRKALLDTLERRRSSTYKRGLGRAGYTRDKMRRALSEGMPEGYTVDVDENFGIIVELLPPSSNESDRGERPTRPEGPEVIPIPVSQFPPLTSRPGECTEKKPLKAAEGSWSAKNVSGGVSASTNARSEGKCDVDVRRRALNITVPTPYTSAEVEVDTIFVCKADLERKTGPFAALFSDFPEAGNWFHTRCESSITVKPNNGPETVIPHEFSYWMPGSDSSSTKSFDRSRETTMVVELPKHSSSLEITLRAHSAAQAYGMKSVAAETSITNSTIRLHRTR
jgi:hypothetical protein